MPRGRKSNPDDNRIILEYALRHLERELEEIQSKIAHVKSQIGAAPAPRVARVAPVAAKPAAAAPAAPAAAAPAGRKQRVLSAAARARIALAQKRRWAAHRKAKAAASKA